MINLDYHGLLKHTGIPDYSKLLRLEKNYFNFHNSKVRLKGLNLILKRSNMRTHAVMHMYCTYAYEMIKIKHQKFECFVILCESKLLFHEN